MKVYVVHYYLFGIEDGHQSMIDSAVKGVFGTFDAATDYLRNIARTYGLYVSSGADEIAVYGTNACYTVAFDKNGKTLDPYFDDKVYEKMVVKKIWDTEEFEVNQ